jgi:hypothetical protein
MFKKYIVNSCLAVVLVLLFQNCYDNAHNDDEITVFDRIRTFEKKLLHMSTREEERAIMRQIRELCYVERKADLSLSAVDEYDKQVIQDLSKAHGKITVTVSFRNTAGGNSQKSGWCYQIDFNPIALENVYMLLQE